MIRIHTRRAATALAVLLLTTLLAGCADSGPAADDGTPDDLTADALVGTWVWDFGGVYGVDENAMRTQLDIQSVADDGTVTGSETFYAGGQEMQWELTSATAQRDNRWRLHIERGLGTDAVEYDLTLQPSGEALVGHFEKANWSTDEATFNKQPAP
ncbi:MAG TPA: hypothetical protein VHQ65_04175 [Thermoanaerobaculia bacterium]|nr:hypothetical protein [Thermoanaerobaculia bacterium]